MSERILSDQLAAEVHTSGSPSAPQSSINEPPASVSETATNSSPTGQQLRTSPTDSSALAANTVKRPPIRRASGSENGDGPELIGHLNPEGIFVALTRPDASGASQLDDSLGHWVPRGADARVLDDGQLTQINRHHKSASTATSFDEPTISSVQSNQQWLDFLPDLESFVVLRDIYLKEIHPLFPIFQPEAIPNTFVRGELRCNDTLLMLSVCLSVAASPAARPHLPLQHRDGVWTPELFIRRLSQTLTRALETAGSADKLRAARVFTALSLFSQLSADDHASAEYCARAVSYSQTLQLHLETAHVRKDDAMAIRLFLCVWALDRLNAAFHSRPVLIHPCDVGRNMEALIAQQEPGFRVFLVTCGLLEEIIDLYRPFRESVKGKDDLWFPSFEDLVVRADAVQCETHLLGQYLVHPPLPYHFQNGEARQKPMPLCPVSRSSLIPALTATVETLYHSVAMLSHRCNSLQNPDRSSVSYLRANLFVARLTTIMRTNFGSSLSSFPFIPYALSLSLRVSYRELRFSKVPLHRSIARDQLLSICGLLEHFVEIYGFVRRLVTLAIRTIEEMDKVAVSVLQARRDGREGSTQTMTLSGDGAMHSGSTGHNRSAASRSGHPDVQAEVSEPHTPAERSNTFQISRYDAAQYTAKRFDSVYQIPDMPDLFEHFDPEFNLDAVDFVLVQNDGGVALPGSGLGPEEGWIYGPMASDMLPNSADRCVTPSATRLRP